MGCMSARVWRQKYGSAGTQIKAAASHQTSSLLGFQLASAERRGLGDEYHSGGSFQEPPP